MFLLVEYYSIQHENVIQKDLRQSLIELPDIRISLSNGNDKVVHYEYALF